MQNILYVVCRYKTSWKTNLRLGKLNYILEWLTQYSLCLNLRETISYNQIIVDGYTFIRVCMNFLHTYMVCIHAQYNNQHYSL